MHRPRREEQWKTVECNMNLKVQQWTFDQAKKFLADRNADGIDISAASLKQIKSEDSGDQDC